MTENGTRQESKLAMMLRAPDMQKRFEGMLGKKAAGFISSILSAASQNPALKECNPMSVISSAAVAASLDLPINQSLSFAHIVPYKKVAQFQMGWRGFVQLAIRTGQYKTIHVSDVYDDELGSWNPLTGEMEFTSKETWVNRNAGSDFSHVLGYVAFFKLTNGFEKYYYMTKEEIDAHARKYSKSYDNERGRWKQDFDGMAKKTVIKLLLSKYGILSIEMHRAIETDQAAIKEDGSMDYIDNEPEIPLVPEVKEKEENNENK